MKIGWLELLIATGLTYGVYKLFYSAPPGVIYPVGTIVHLPNGTSESLAVPTSTANLPEGTWLNDTGSIIVHNGQPYDMGASPANG